MHFWFSNLIFIKWTPLWTRSEPAENLWQFTSYYFGFSFISDLSSIQLATSGDRKYIARENRRSTNRAKLDKLLIYNGTERSRLQSSAPLAASPPACKTFCLQIDKRLQSCWASARIERRSFRQNRPSEQLISQYAAQAQLNWGIEEKRYRSTWRVRSGSALYCKSARRYLRFF